MKVQELIGLLQKLTAAGYGDFEVCICKDDSAPEPMNEVKTEFKGSRVILAVE